MVHVALRKTIWANVFFWQISERQWRNTRRIQL